ncbi:glyoxylate/hydroxypyruvate reductase B-like isoform X3 [Chroicocephalus ridibundus]|uniref:glyoxylate/hydroxypyruvate reductase B-like isoform X3 n=1 Tax=Chroicocephalus ridibundus TaxID=1192867 RepID=UPI002FDEB857
MFRSKGFGLLKLIPLMSGQPNLAYKFIHPAIASHGHCCHRRSVDYRQRYKTCPGSAGGRTLSAPQTKIMAEEELPGVLILDVGGTHGVLEDLAALLKKHFRLITMKEFIENKKEMSKKIQSVFVFECRPTIDRELLESLPNLKVIGNSGVGVDHLDLKMISNFGVKVTNTPHAVADPTADIGVALMLASARRLVEGCQITVSPDTKYFAVDWLGVEVTRATLGIIGMGSIGYKVAQRARAFNMRILYHNRNRRHFWQQHEEHQHAAASLLWLPTAPLGKPLPLASCARSALVSSLEQELCNLYKGVVQANKGLCPHCVPCPARLFFRLLAASLAHPASHPSPQPSQITHHTSTNCKGLIFSQFYSSLSFRLHFPFILFSTSSPNSHVRQGETL